jgi:uncharacterized RDD family membrane protein YckC
MEIEQLSAGVFRRLGAMLYDSLLVAALLMVVTALLLPLTHGEALTRQTLGPFEYLYRSVLLLALVGFFGLFWTRRGQTLGMQVWRLRVQKIDGGLLSWSDVVKRMGAAFVSFAVAGFGYWWIWIDKERLAWPDRWTGTRVVVLHKKSRVIGDK